MGAAAITWAIWCTGNDIVFEKKQNISFMQAIFRGAHWLQFWVQQQHEDKRGTFRSASRALGVIAVDVFATNGCEVII